jgi:hypothetical protein
VPSTMDSPIWGMMMSVGMISFHAGPEFGTGRTQINIIAGAAGAEAQREKRCLRGPKGPLIHSVVWIFDF